MGPNEIIFFPVKVELNPDLMVEISTGNTSEISTSNTLKSADMAKNKVKNQDFDPENWGRRNFYGSQILIFQKVWGLSFILHLQSTS